MNLGGIFTGLGVNRNRDNIFGINKTILIILIVIIVIFGFGYGRGLFNAYGGGGGYGSYTEFRYIDPPNKSRNKHRRKNRKYDKDDIIAYRAKFGYMNPGFEYGGYGFNPGYGFPGIGGYASPYGGVFSNDWWFILAIIALLLLLGQETENENNESNSNNL